MSKKFATFKEFWPEYLRLHSKPVTRAIHYSGTLGGIALAATGIALSAPALIIASPLFIYALLLPSHPLFEKNKPATLKNPLMSVGGDFKMLFFWLTGRVRAEYKKHGLDYTGKTGNNQNDTAAPVTPESNAPSRLAGFKHSLRKIFSKRAKPAAVQKPTAPAQDSQPKIT
jgi:hypothetical protein